MWKSPQKASVFAKNISTKTNARSTRNKEIKKAHSTMGLFLFVHR
jgi:hypothetical protein